MHNGRFEPINRINPDINIALGLNVMSPIAVGVAESVEILGSFLPTPEEMDAMTGDATLFARQDYVEEAWRIVDPVLKQGTLVYTYEPGSWGQDEIDQKVVPPGGWHNPVISD